MNAFKEPERKGFLCRSACMQVGKLLFPYYSYFTQHFGHASTSIKILSLHRFLPPHVP
jgi:hypothetical protein